MKRLWYHVIMVVLGVSMLFVSAKAGTKQVSSSNITVSSRSLFGLAQSVIVDNGYAYIAADNSVISLSISTPSHPSYFAFSYPMEYVQDLASNTDYIFATIGEGGIEVIPKATSDDSSTIKTYNFGTFMGQVAIDRSKGILYVATQDSGVMILRIDNDSLSVVGTITGGFGSPNDVEYSNDTLVVGGSGGVYVYNVSVPESPAALDSMVTKYSVCRVGFEKGKIIYAMNWDYNWEPHYNVVLFDGNLGLLVEEGNGMVSDICVNDTNMFILNSSGKITYYVLSNGNPVKIDELPLSSPAHDLDADSSFVYLIEDDGFHIIRYDNGTLEPVSVVYSALVSNELAAYQNYLFSAAGNNGIMVLDISDTLRPDFTAHIPDNNVAMALSVKDTLLLCASLLQHLSIYNVSNPASPLYVGDLYIHGNPMDVAWKGDAVYVATNTYGVSIVDISDPYNPSVRGNISSGNVTQSVTVYGNLLVVSDLSSGTYIFNISDPLSPSYISNVNASRAAALNDTLLVIARTNNTAEVYDIKDPSNPDLLYTISLPSTANSLKIYGNMLYAACGDSGVRVFSLGSDSATLEGYFETDNKISDVLVLNSSLFYVSEDLGGVYLLSGNFAKIFGISEVADDKPVIIFNRGNIVKNTLEFTVNASGSIEYRLIDVTGRVVREGIAEGRREVRLGGLPGGIYYMVVHSAYGDVSRSLIIR